MEGFKVPRLADTARGSGRGLWDLGFRCFARAQPGCVAGSDFLSHWVCVGVVSVGVVFFGVVFDAAFELGVVPAIAVASRAAPEFVAAGDAAAPEAAESAHLEMARCLSVCSEAGQHRLRVGERAQYGGLRC